ncbi:hypothetical protein GCM10009546_51540 [Actinomadura livida]|uniref:Uncharacterized protein n=1 Tax=Actinomadura livida TaxID=79909 RepID=A0ABN1F5E8_9ACTN|nr:hypothetical protein GCM10010208_72250 [Actinomadura livida]
MVPVFNGRDPPETGPHNATHGIPRTHRDRGAHCVHLGGLVSSAPSTERTTGLGDPDPHTADALVADPLTSVIDTVIAPAARAATSSGSRRGKAGSPPRARRTPTSGRADR